ncbi:MAG: cysteine synthase A [Candidatus Bathyarchaeia archaeon]|jgi:cysteine synthase A
MRNYCLKVVENALELIGDTPMIKLSFPEEDTVIYAKVEYLNPSGSVKDRIARYLITEAEKRGELKPGYTIVEATSGNTGIAFSCAAAAKGYKMIVVMPETASVERRTIMKHYNAEVILTPAKDFIAGAVKKAAEIAKRPKHWAPCQFDNNDNVRAHEMTTAQEILGQVPEGKVDAFVAGIGTGGTLMGVSNVLRRKNPGLKVYAVDPIGKNVEGDVEPLKCAEHKVEGIGDGFIPSITDVKIIDEVIQVTDRNAIATAQMLARKKGLFVGNSSGAYVWCALQAAKKLGKGKVVVTLLPDSADRYYSTDLFKE